MKISRFRIILVLSGLLISFVSLIADMIGLGDPTYGIGASQMAGILAGIITAGFGFIPDSIYRTRIPFLVLGVLVLLIVPFPFHFGYTMTRIQNFMHFPVFFALSIAMLIIFRKLPIERKGKWILPLILLLFIAGASELLQAVMPGRTPDFRDAAVNLFGILCGSVTFYILKRKIPDRWIH